MMTVQGLLLNPWAGQQLEEEMLSADPMDVGQVALLDWNSRQILGLGVLKSGHVAHW